MATSTVWYNTANDFGELTLRLCRYAQCFKCCLYSLYCTWNAINYAIGIGKLRKHSMYTIARDVLAIVQEVKYHGFSWKSPLEIWSLLKCLIHTVLIRLELEWALIGSHWVLSFPAIGSISHIDDGKYNLKMATFHLTDTIALTVASSILHSEPKLTEICWHSTHCQW